MVNKLFGYSSVRALAVERFIMLQKFPKNLITAAPFHFPPPRSTSDHFKHTFPPCVTDLQKLQNS
jgi:hypothetical protein